MKSTAIKAAKEAGKLIMKYYGKKYKIKHKSPVDVATEADIKAEELIKKIINKKYPKHSFLGEESGHDCKNSDYLWIIDPIDGTSNFLHHLDHFCISIALQYKSEIILGVILDPLKKELFVGEKSKGSYLNSKKLKVKPRPKLINHNLNFGFGHDVKNLAPLFSKVRKLREHTQSQRIFGSFALDLCYVAANRFGINIQHGSKVWDIAAALIILKEADGIITDEKGKDISIHDYKLLVASNKKIHKKVLEIIK